MGSQLGLKEAVSMALGGMIGGGIYSAFGIVVAISGKAAWIAFLAAGIVAMCAGYSYVKLNNLVDGYGGAPTYIENFVGNATLAGMTGWTLLVGYIASMALYAYAFSSFFAEMIGRMHVLSGMVPVANSVAVLLIAFFVFLNIVGVHETGLVEDVLVVIKVGIIALFGLWGVWFTFSQQQLSLGLSALGFDPVKGAAMSFVAFQGWQLLMYDQDNIEDPKDSIRTAIYVAIPTATFLYIVVALTVVSLLTVETVAVVPEVSLLYAALSFMGRLGAFVVGLSALFSTASAVNATLFSSALFSRGLIADDLLPDQFDRSDDGDQMPTYLVITLGALSAAFAVYGSLSSITSFASLAFIAVFGGMSYLAFTQRDETDMIAAIPLVGFVGSVAFFPLLLYNLYRNSPGVFGAVLIIAVLVITVELFYFEREPIEENIERLRS